MKIVHEKIKDGEIEIEYDTLDFDIENRRPIGPKRSAKNKPKRKIKRTKQTFAITNKKLYDELLFVETVLSVILRKG